MDSTCIERRSAARVAIVAALFLGGCSVVGEFRPSVTWRAVSPGESIAAQRGDILTTGQPSALTTQTVRVTGLDLDACATLSSPGCVSALTAAGGISDERRLSALAELWLQQAISASLQADPRAGDATSVAPWMETMRYAYAYLFYTRRAPGERAFEDRQTQVRDWYNYAAQQAVAQLFGARETKPGIQAQDSRVRFGEWTLRVESKARLPGDASVPAELLPASTLAFGGLRSIYRRDGFGAAMVAVADIDPVARKAIADLPAKDEWPASRRRATLPPAWSEMPAPNVTAVFRFDAPTLDQLLRTREVILDVHDPLMESELTLHAHRVPLAGNFTAGYALWLARSGFNRQSLRTLFGREHGIDHPHLYLMQPFDPDRRIVLMLHGLASSPEAWVNVANELLGDEGLRREFQIWQVHYPTNMPVPANHAAIRRLLHEVLRHFDPEGRAAASRGLILVGHSMGGLIARLMVSTADRELWDWASTDLGIDPDLLDRSRPLLDPMLRFQPFPGVERVIFIATPHRGTAVAGHGLARWASRLVRLPLTLLEAFGIAFQGRAEASATSATRVLETIPTSVDQLDEHDPFLRAAARLPISDRVRYHSIIARLHADGELESSDDGLVPYRSAHLAGAASEKTIVSGHSVQETAASILEVRRILQEDLAPVPPRRNPSPFPPARSADGTFFRPVR